DPRRHRPGHVAVRDADVRPVDLLSVPAEADLVRRGAAVGVERRRIQAEGAGDLNDRGDVARPDGHHRAKRRRGGGDHQIRELTMKLRALFAVLLALVPSHAAFAQLAPPNARGVAFSHLHFSTQDPAAFRNFWVAFGGTSTPNLDLDLVQLPGVYLVTFQRDQIAPMDDETTPIVTFKVRNLNESIANWIGRSLVVERAAIPGQAYVYAPGPTRSEILEDKSIAAPLQFYRV